MDDTSRRLNNEGHTPRTDPQTRDLDDDSAERARELRSEIEQTRENMSETIGAIQEKLRPGNIASAATDRVKSAASRAARNVADSANQTAQQAFDSTRRMADDLAEDGRMNKVAGAMIAIGSGWLLMNRWLVTGRRRTWRSRPRTYSSRPHELYGAQWRRPSEVNDDYEYGSSEVHDDYRNDVETASDEGVLARGYERASSMADDARERAAEGMYRARNAFSELLDSNPLIVGCAAMAVGATIGLALPETERENEWLGDTKESLVERAQDVARNTANQVRKAAGDIAGQVASDVVSGENKSE
jgi:uncharacterized protein DUF3618